MTDSQLQRLVDLLQALCDHAQVLEGCLGFFAGTFFFLFVFYIVFCWRAK